MTTRVKAIGRREAFEALAATAGIAWAAACGSSTTAMELPTDRIRPTLSAFAIVADKRTGTPKC